MPFILKIILGVVAGLLLALVIPHDTTVIPTFGTLFVKALKSIAPILVFFLIMAAVSKHKPQQQTQLKPIIIIYIISMLLSSATALIMATIFPSTFTILEAAKNDMVAPQGIMEVILNFIQHAVDNPVTALIEGNYIALLVWAVAIGLALRKTNEATINMIEDASQAIASVVRLVIRFAPLGVMGLVYASVTTTGGFSNLLNYAHVLAVLVITMLIIAFGINAIIVYITTGENPYPLIFKTIAESGITAFFTRSSAANLPVNMRLCEKLGLPKDTYSLSIPLGSAMNMSGAAVTIIIMTMAAVHTLNIEVDFGSAFIMCTAAVLCACGASGIAGGSLMLIPLACSIFGINNDIAMQVVGIGFIVGVLQDSTETALNSSSDVLFTAAACRREEKRLAKMKAKA